MRQWIAGLMIAAVLAACGGAKPPVSTSPAPAAIGRESIPGSALDLLQNGIGERRLVLLGEMHGTREIPALAGELVARYARDRERVVLALEMIEDDQAAVDRYLDSPGDAADRAVLLSGRHWREPTHDGRDSEAMLGLIECVRTLRAQGDDVRIVAFDPGDAGDSRDRGMAERLRAAAMRHPQARLLVLAGNVHAMLRAPQNLMLDGKPYQPITAGRLLADLDPLSIRISALAGESVICRQGKCAAQAYTGPAASSAPDYVPEPSSQSPWDATLTLPRFTVSPPAIAAQLPHR